MFLLPLPGRILSFTTVSMLLLLTCLSCMAAPDSSGMSLKNLTTSLGADHPGQSGAYVFEKGEESLMARAWLTDHAVRTIDVQYFIWSTDNIGILAAEALLRAADRGVKVRVIVDDLLIDAPDTIMIALNDHENIQIRIYNPKHSVGTSKLQRLLNVALQFRSVNQRMHDKTFTVDGVASITGGRNMADEYFDYDHRYNFRDRDILLLGPVVQTVEDNFTAFWQSAFVLPVEQLLSSVAPAITDRQREEIYADLHAYALNPLNFSAEVRGRLDKLHLRFDDLRQALSWGHINFIHDIPGKNLSTGLSGSSDATEALIKALSEARETVTIQSPYLIMPEGGIEFFRKLIARGVKVRISTNSLASTDNLQAFSGYLKQRKDILKAGIEVFEYKPDPAIQLDLIERYEALKKGLPTFAIHAKSMVIDHQLVFIGTFNLDPRSAHLNTEVGVLIRSPDLAAGVEESIELDMRPENSWNAATDKPDKEASFAKRIKVYLWSLLPLNPIL
jgi:putative cardiolipin synthase